MSLTSHESKSNLESAVHESKSSPKSLFMRLKCDSSPSLLLEFPSLIITFPYMQTILFFFCQILNRFGTVSGYTINWQKSEFMSLGADLDSEFLHNLPFKITDRLKYLET